MEERTIQGDKIPSVGDWILLIAGKIRADHKSFADVESWELNDGPDEVLELSVVYKSGRDEQYTFDMTCVAGGSFLPMYQDIRS